MIWERVKELEEELLKLREERERIIEKLSNLPMGHIDIKEINGNKYYYLRYWEDGRLRSKYLGKNADEVKKQLEYANELRRNLSKIRERERKIEKILEKIEKIIKDI
jgi:hypothetical protein